MLRRLEVGLLCIVVICVLCVVPWWSACGDKEHTSGIRIRLFSAKSELSPATPDGPHPFAYVLYATSDTYLCSAVINAVRLKDLNVTVAADIVIIIDQAWLERSSTAVARRLRVLRALDVKLVGVKVLQQTGDPVWAQSLTKLHLFGLTQYKRLIYMDADGLVLRNMDYLFSLPDAPVAMPRAYWLSQPRMCNALAVVQPSAQRLEQLLQRARTHGGFDMDVMNDLYKGQCLVLPNEYIFLTGELRETNHTRYLGNDLLPWNATAELLRAYYVHFSDNPLPKPWLLRPEELASNDSGPSCPPHCEERSLWTSLYQSYHRQMMYC